MLENLAKNHKNIIVVEEAIKKGGFGESVEAYAQENNLNTKVSVMAIEDKFVEQGSVEELRDRLGITSSRHKLLIRSLHRFVLPLCRKQRPSKQGR